METICTDNMTRTIAESAARLKERVDYHNKLIAATFGIENIDDRIKIPADSTLLRQVLYETIEILEETKKTFKSKKLEMLRKKLLNVLMEHPSG